MKDTLKALEKWINGMTSERTKGARYRIVTSIEEALSGEYVHAALCDIESNMRLLRDTVKKRKFHADIIVLLYEQAKLVEYVKETELNVGDVFYHSWNTNVRRVVALEPLPYAKLPSIRSEVVRKAMGGRSWDFGATLKEHMSDDSYCYVVERAQTSLDKIRQAVESKCTDEELQSLIESHNATKEAKP